MATNWGGMPFAGMGWSELYKCFPKQKKRVCASRSFSFRRAILKTPERHSTPLRAVRVRSGKRKFGLPDLHVVFPGQHLLSRCWRIGRRSGRRNRLIARADRRDRAGDQAIVNDIISPVFVVDRSLARSPSVPLPVRSGGGCLS